MAHPTLPGPPSPPPPGSPPPPSGPPPPPASHASWPPPAAGGDPSPLERIARWPVRLVALLVDLVVSFARDLMAAEFHANRIRTKGLPSGVRFAVVVAIVGIIALLVSIAVADAWRSGFESVTLPGGQALRGTLVPEPLIPVTFALLAFGAAMCLSGAIRATAPIAFGVLVVYLVLAGFLHSSSALETDLLHRAGGWAIGAVAALFVAARFVRPRPNLELVVLFGLVGLTFGDAHRLLVETDRMTGTGFLGAQTQILLADIVQLSIPVLVVAALDVVDFGIHAARWGFGFVDRRLGTRAVLVGLVLLALWRGRDLVVEISQRAGGGEVGAMGREVVGAAVLIAAIAGAFAMIRRSAARHPSADGVTDPLAPSDPEVLTGEARPVALPVALGLLAAMLSGAVLLLAAQATPALLEGDALVRAQELVAEWVQITGDFAASVGWELGRAAVLALAVVVLARRNRPLPAIFLASVAAVMTHGALSNRGRVLEAWSWSLLALDVLIVGALVALVVRWLVRRELSGERAGWALFLLLLTGLLRQADFVSDPFSPLLAISAVGFVLFGLAWGFAVNGSWANEGTAAMPRIARVQLLLGYQLLSAAILHWFVVTHSLTYIEMLGTDMPDLGLEWLGRPLVLALIITGIAAAWQGVPLDVPTADEAMARADAAE